MGIPSYPIDRPERPVFTFPEKTEGTFSKTLWVREVGLNSLGGCLGGGVKVLYSKVVRTVAGMRESGRNSNRLGVWDMEKSVSNCTEREKDMGKGCTGG